MVGAAAAARIMADVTPAPPIAELVWSHELRFDATAKSHTFPVDSDSAEGPSPTQLLAVSLAACMSMDIVDILRKGRHPLTSFSCTVAGERIKYSMTSGPDTFSEVEDPAPAMFPPVEAPSTAELSTKIDAAATRTDASITSAQDAADSARTVSIIAIIVALVAIVLGAIGWQRARKATTA